MNYNFTDAPNRKKTGSYKWNAMYEVNSAVKDNAVPLSTADMEFETMPEILQGLQDFLGENVVLGYTGATDQYLESVVNWFKRRYGYAIKKEWILQTPGVVDGFTAAIQTLSQPGDGVILFRPIYYPMGNAISESKLTEVNVPLINNDGYYTIDFEKFEEAAKDEKNKILLFCSPHNPTTRVWTREELERLGKICLENNVYIVSDEIWADLIFDGYEHIVLASLSKEIEDITITCTAPSKTFNLAGLATSNIIISNDEIRNEFIENHFSLVNTMGYKACELAYNKGEKWLEQLLEVIQENNKLCQSFFKERGFNYTETEGTYLFWMDFTKLEMTNEELEEFLNVEASFFTTQGYVFGEEGDQFQRINMALPTEDLQNQLNNLDQALKTLA